MTYTYPASWRCGHQLTSYDPHDRPSTNCTRPVGRSFATPMRFFSHSGRALQVLQRPPASSSVLQRPPASSSILQHPPASSSILQRPPASSSVLQRPPAYYEAPLDPHTMAT